MLNLAFDRYCGSHKNLEVVLCHGLFGNRSNFTRLAKKLNDELDVTVHSLDMRNHGDSPHSPDVGYRSLSYDIQHHIDSHIRPEKTTFILGHSMGGKACFAHAQMFDSNRTVARCAVDMSMNEALQVDRYYPWIDLMIELSTMGLNDRKSADKMLSALVEKKSIRDYLLMNYAYDSSGRLRLRSNLTHIRDGLKEIASYPPDLHQFYLKKQPPAFPIRTPLYILKGNKSQFVTDESITRLRKVFRNVEVQGVDAGHWCISEKFDESYKVIKNWIENYLTLP